MNKISKNSNNKKFAVSRWIFLSLSLLMNTFLVLYSTLPREITIKWNNFVTNIFASIANTFTEKEVETIPMKELDVFVSPESSHKYNNIPGYAFNEIPLGSAKQIECTYGPINATDKSIQFYTDNPDIISLRQTNTTVSVVGMKAGTAKIHAKNTLSGLDKAVDVVVVDTAAPSSFEISLKSTEIAIGSQQTLNFDIDGGVLGHNELINFRYYDTTKLSYISSNTSVATVNEYGVITPINPGAASITVSNESECSKTVDISVVSGTSPSLYTNLNISGSSICYGNDMIKDQSGGKNHYELTIKDGEEVLDNEDFIWQSSNDLLVRVDKHGVIRGFRKSSTNDETATIKAISKLTGQFAEFTVTVKEELPSELYYWIINNGKTYWNQEEYSCCVGDYLELNVSYKPNVSKKDILFTVSKENIIECIGQGASIGINVKDTGTCNLTITSVVNPSLSKTIKITVLKAGAIDANELDGVGFNLRKIIGHASLFAIAEVFTLIALYMFLYDKKQWIAIVASLGTELLLSSISELVQHYTPNRSGTIKDVAINFAGAFVGALICVSIYLLVRYIKKKKNKQ